MVRFFPLSLSPSRAGRLVDGDTCMSFSPRSASTGTETPPSATAGSRSINERNQGDRAAQHPVFYLHAGQGIGHHAQSPSEQEGAQGIPACVRSNHFIDPPLNGELLENLTGIHSCGPTKRLDLTQDDAVPPQGGACHQDEKAR